MTEKELKKLSRADLLEMLIDQSTELQTLREKLDTAETALKSREIAIDKAGSLAEASLQLNGVFEAAQAASEQYMENIRRLSERQEAVCRRMEKESRDRADRQLAAAEKKCEAMEAETKVKCAEMLEKAEAESQKYWEEVTAKLEAFYDEHTGLRELLSIVMPKKEQK